MNLAETAGRAADAAGQAIRPYFRTGLAADLKADESPVTAADHAAERAIRAVLAEQTPGIAVVGEEEGGAINGELCWVVDPIDGTRAFLTGRPTFTTLIALLRNGEPILGIIDQPITRERWIGAAGEPTHFRGPFGHCATRTLPALSEAELSATSPELFGPHLPRFHSLAAACRRTTWGGDAYAYGLLALGQIDVIAERDMKVWDWAALVPVVRGAGGLITDWSGQDLRPGAAGDVLALGTPALLAAARALLA